LNDVTKLGRSSGLLGLLHHTLNAREKYGGKDTDNRDNSEQLD